MLGFRRSGAAANAWSSGPSSLRGRMGTHRQRSPSTLYARIPRLYRKIHLINPRLNYATSAAKKRNMTVRSSVLPFPSTLTSSISLWAPKNSRASEPTPATALQSPTNPALSNGSKLLKPPLPPPTPTTRSNTHNVEPYMN